MQWKFDPVGGPWMAVALALLLVALPWLVGLPRAGITPRGRASLLGLRLLASALLLFAWVRPTLVTVQTEPLRRALLLLVDASRSMGVEDALGGASRWKSAVQLLDASSGALGQIAQKHAVRAYHFGEGLEEVALESGHLTLPAKPEANTTTIGQSLSDLIDREGQSRLMGVVLLSDGAQRAIPPRDLSPLTAARRLVAEGVPLYAFALGDRASRTRADLAVEDLLVSERAFAGAPFAVKALLRTAGYPNRAARVQLLWENADGKQPVVDTSTVTITPGIDTYPIALTHTPTEAGEWKLTLRAEPLDGETLTSNNRVSTFVTVRDGGIRVLYLAGAARVGGGPGIEQRFVRASLAASPDMDVRRPPHPFDYRRPRRDLTPLLTDAGVDVVILDNLDADALNRASWDQLASLVERGAGLAMLGGAHSFGPGGHRATRLADVLPIIMGRAERQAFGQPVREEGHLAGPLRMVPAKPLGEHHPVMQLGNLTSPSSSTRRGNLTAWETLPPLDGANRFDRRRLKANGVVLAETAGPGTLSPLLVAGQPGVGRVLAFAGDSTWRWVMEGEGELHRRFWRQVVLWLARQEEETDNPVRIELASRRVAPGTRLGVAASLRLPASDPSPADLRYEATVTLPDGSKEPLLLPSEASRAVTTFRKTSLAGDYTVEVTGYVDGKQAGVARSRFLVPLQDLELDRPAADPGALARLAEVTAPVGGRALAPEELPTFLEELAERKAEEKQQVISRYTPWDTWPFLLLLVGVLTLEWGLRRRWGMP